MAQTRERHQPTETSRPPTAKTTATTRRVINGAAATLAVLLLFARMFANHSHNLGD